MKQPAAVTPEVARAAAPRLRRWLLALGVTMAGVTQPATARGADYGNFIDVENDADLADLLASQEIDSAAYEVLTQLLEDGVDLDTASRDELYGLPNLSYEEADKIIAFREVSGGISDPAALVSGGVLSERKLLAISAFLLAPDARGRVDFHGRVRYRSAYVIGDGKAPAMLLGARAHTLHRALELGITGVLTRNQIGDPQWDPSRGGLSAEPADYRLRVPKFFLQYKTDHFHGVAGTFRIGFGQRLVLDNTARYAPNGIQVDDQIYFSRDSASACLLTAGELSQSPCVEAQGNGYEAPDFKWPERFRGVAIGYHSPEFGNGSSVQAYAFASYQTRGIYQYELYDRGRCTDPNGLGDECKAPPVYRRDPHGDPFAPASTYSYTTLPNMFNEATAGGNFSWFFHRRAHLGITGYGSTVSMLAGGADLSFQEWSRWPYAKSGTDSWGAIGADFAWGRGWFDLFGEVARSIDSQSSPGVGGGNAAILRATASFKRQELELSGRYYDTTYNNPFARPISASDEYEGLRATNESGVRLRYIGGVGDLEVRSYVDAWWDLKRLVPELRFRTRAEYALTWWFAPALIVDFYDKNIDLNSGGQCFYSEDGTSTNGPMDCNGRRVQLGANLKFTPTRRFSLTLRYLHWLVDDPKYPTSSRQDITVWALMGWRVNDWLQLRARVRYLSEDIANPNSGEESVWAMAEATFTAQRRWIIRPRYQLNWLIDQRASTLVRSPNPEHWLRLDVEYRF